MSMGNGVSSCVIFIDNNPDNFIYNITIKDQNKGLVGDILLPDITGRSIFKRTGSN
jgi:hypothetical protein